MSKGKQYKNYGLNTKDDYKFIFLTLIKDVVASLEEYKAYCSELESMVEPYLKSFETDDAKQKERFVSAEKYRGISHKLHDVSSNLLSLIADMQDSSMSYKMLRKIAKHKGSPVELPSLDKEVEDDMNELLNVRNWSFHNPQSMLVASREVFEKSIPEKLRGYIDFTYNPVIVMLPQKYDSMYMISLWLHTTRRIEVFSRILKSMLKDYSAVLGKPAMYKITHDQRVTPFINESTKAIQLSMAIQKGKYNGEQDKFDEITFASERNSNKS